MEILTDHSFYKSVLSWHRPETVQDFIDEFALAFINYYTAQIRLWLSAFPGLQIRCGFIKLMLGEVANCSKNARQCWHISYSVCSNVVKMSAKREVEKCRQHVARFRLYRHRFLQVNTRLGAFFKIYKIIYLIFLKSGRSLQILHHLQVVC